MGRNVRPNHAVLHRPIIPHITECRVVGTMLSKHLDLIHNMVLALTFTSVFVYNMFLTYARNLWEIVQIAPSIISKMGTFR